MVARLIDGCPIKVAPGLLPSVGMTAPILVLILAALTILVARVWLLIVAFRTSLLWGVVTLLVPFGSIVFALRHWVEAKTPFLLGVLGGCACGAVIALSPDTLRTGDEKPGNVARRDAHPTGPPREAHDLAAKESASTPALTPPSDPFAAQRAAYTRHAAELTAEYAQLNAERVKLKPGDPAVAAFNVKAAQYQRGVQALQTEMAQLDTLDHPASPNVPAKGDHSRAGTTVGASPADTVGNADLARLRQTLDQGDYAGFAALLRKSLADDQRSAVFPQIVAFGRQAMQCLSLTNLPAAIQQQGVAVRAEIKATVASVQALVNQVPPVVVKPPGAKSQTRSYHPGATKPDFNTADVVSGREGFPGAEYLQWEGKPNVFYRSEDCEFNSQTKMFYTARDVPKKKLTDAETQELVRLYRLIGKDEAIINTLPKRLAEAQNTLAELVALNIQLASMK